MPQNHFLQRCAAAFQRLPSDGDQDGEEDSSENMLLQNTQSREPEADMDITGMPEYTFVSPSLM
jgi:hypothetical protein